MVKTIFDKPLTADNKVQSRDSNFFSEMRSKAVNAAPILYDKWPVLTSIPKELKMDYSRILEKPFFVKNITWVDFQTPGTQIQTLTIPSDIIVNELIHKPYLASVYYRMKLCLLIQVSGTPMHSGMLLVGAVPDSAIVTDHNQLLSSPHAFLFANESTPVCLEVPFYSPTSVRYTSISSVAPDTFDYAKIVFRVVNQLGVPTGGTTGVTVSVQAIVTHSEFYVPAINPTNYIDAQSETSFSNENSLFNIPTKIFDGLAQGAKSVVGDVIDVARSTVRAYTGFHNPNSTSIDQRMLPANRNFPNNVDQPTLYEKFDPYAQFDRITYDHLFDTAQDEMDMKFILSKPALVGTFVVNSTDLSGTRLFTSPITPFIETSEALQGTFYSPMRLLFESSLYWRGTLKMHIQSSMNNFQYCKLLVCRNYEIPANALYQYLPMDEVSALMTETLEFSAGGQTQTIDLPFCSVLEQLSCAKDSEMNALAHGLVTIYLLQPLVLNGSSPLKCEFNVYFSAGEDFQFYGYTNDNLLINDVPNLEAQSAITVEPSNQDDVLNSPAKMEDSLLRSLDFKPIVNVRDYIRRVNLVYQRKVEPADTFSKVITLPIVDLLKGQVASTVTSSALIRSMFYGCTGGFKFKIKAYGSPAIAVKYIPPQYYDSVNDVGIADVWYATTPQGLGDSGVDYRLREDPLSTVFDTVLPNSTPFQEIPVFSVPSIGSSNNSTNLQVCEFVVPNMSPFRFVSSDALYSEQFIDIAPCSYGHITINVIRSNPTVEQDRDLWLSIYMGATDETRLGQHSYFPGAKVPNTGVPNLRYRTKSDFNMGDNGTSLDGRPKLTTSNIPGSYYIKTT